MNIGDFMKQENELKDQIVNPFVILASIVVFAIFANISYENHKRVNPHNHSVYSALEQFYTENVVLF